MFNIVWVLMLSVCNTDQCITQTVLETSAKDRCMYHKIMHEQLPMDGNWKTIEYKCKPKNSQEA